MKLPTNTQFLNSLYAIRAASEQATLAYYFEGNGHNADGYKTRAITELKLAAISLGFELVERLPGNDAATARLIRTIDEAAEAPGGGRMDIAEVEDA